MAYDEKHVFSTPELPKRLKLWSCQKVCDGLQYLSDTIFIDLAKMYERIVGIPMGTNCAPLVEDLVLSYYERDFMLSFSDNYQADVADAFDSTASI